MVVVQLALVLAKSRKHEYDDGLYHSDDNMENFVYKRAGVRLFLTTANFSSFPVK